MENTKENKARFFAQYLGSDFENTYTRPTVLRITGATIDLINNERMEQWKDSKVILKPLSSISDEDAVELGSVLGFMNFTKVSVEDSGFWIVWEVNGEIRKNKFVFYNDIPFPLADFLRSKGYALPYLGLSVEQQIEYGWIKLQTK